MKSTQWLSWEGCVTFVVVSLLELLASLSPLNVRLDLDYAFLVILAIVLLIRHKGTLHRRVSLRVLLKNETPSYLVEGELALFLTPAA